MFHRIRLLTTLVTLGLVLVGSFAEAQDRRQRLQERLEELRKLREQQGDASPRDIIRQAIRNRLEESGAVTSPRAKEAMSKRPADVKALESALQNFMSALESGDAENVVSKWTDGAEYAGADGTVVEGRQALVQAYSDYFAEMGKMKVTAEIDDIRFLSQGTAIVKGSFEATGEKSDATMQSGYSILFVREDSDWRIGVLREWVKEASLSDLSWLIGDWGAQALGAKVEASYQWEAGQTVILSRFKVDLASSSQMEGLEVITQDPATGVIRGWVFGSSGTIGEVVWERDGDSWVQTYSGSTLDGEPMEATNVIARKGPNSFTWQLAGRNVGGVEQPVKSPQITVNRK